VFERFTENARQAVVIAQDDARRFRHNYIGTEHILLGVLRVDDGLGAKVLGSLGITTDEVRGHIRRIVGPGDQSVVGQIPFTPRAKRVLELSLREALSLGHNHIGTEHVLLGLVREDDGVAATILRSLGADAETVRDKTIELLGIVRPEEYESSMERAGREVGIDVSRSSGSIWWTLTESVPMLLGAILFAAGLLVGWLIWG